MHAPMEGGDMAGQITIRGLKHIRELVFDIPGPGVHLLSGGNGSGKTTVLACLRRIGHSNAFAQHFACSQRSRALDNFDNASITYTLNGVSVKYAYGGERWVPRPRAQQRLLMQFGYPTVHYIGATADRITPRAEDFTPGRLRMAPAEIRDAANTILGTTKFDFLQTINVRRGVGTSAFVLQATPPPIPTYFSERNFSLGELCVLKLLRILGAIANQSLVLIDELELALHPKAQIELFKYLEAIALAKQLTVIFSTHSVSLLKRVSRSRILFLENEGGMVSIIKGCYPTYALGGIAYDEERAPDVVIYVEDEAAAYATDVLARLYLSARYNGVTRAYPVVLVIPVGAFMNVVRFVARGQALLPTSTRVSVLLDHDVEQESVAQWNLTGNHTALAEFQQLANQIGYLPWTPEVGLVTFLRDPASGAQQLLRDRLRDNRINIRAQDFGIIPAAAGGTQRNACKEAVRNVVQHVTTFLPNAKPDQVRKVLFEVFAEWFFANHRDDAMALMGPCIS